MEEKLTVREMDFHEGCLVHQHQLRMMLLLSLPEVYYDVWQIVFECPQHECEVLVPIHPHLKQSLFLDFLE